MAFRPGQFNIHAAIGSWWQLRSFDLKETVSSSQSWWLRNHNREPKGIALLQYTLSGMMQYRDAQGTREVGPGWAALMLSGDHSEYGFPPGATQPLVTQWISFSGAGVAEHWNDIRGRFGSIVYLGADSSVLDAMKNLCRRQRSASSMEKVLAASSMHAFLSRLYALLDESAIATRPPVEYALDDLMTNFTTNFSVKEIAARHGCSREHLTRLFIQRHGVSPAKYLARARVARAAELLRETRLPVPRVATACGFASKQALIRWFRVEIGLLPSQYRQAHLKRGARAR
jgi:AraC-like DNA-binding protein